MSLSFVVLILGRQRIADLEARLAVAAAPGPASALAVVVPSASAPEPQPRREDGAPADPPREDVDMEPPPSAVESEGDAYMPELPPDLMTPKMDHNEKATEVSFLSP